MCLCWLLSIVLGRLHLNKAFKIKNQVMSVPSDSRRMVLACSTQQGSPMMTIVMANAYLIQGPVSQKHRLPKWFIKFIV